MPTVDGKGAKAYTRPGRRNDSQTKGLDAVDGYTCYRDVCKDSLRAFSRILYGASLLKHIGMLTTQDHIQVYTYRLVTAQTGGHDDYSSQARQ